VRPCAIAKPVWEARVCFSGWLWWPRRAGLRVACWPVQVVSEPVYDLFPGEGGDCCWKRQVVRPVSNSLQVREFVGKRFLPESVQHQLRALRLPDPACCRDPEREVSTDGLCL
jgi:hypothetical protein